MKCSKCGTTGLCFFDAARKLVCRACRDAEQDKLRLAQMTAKYVGKTGTWLKPIDYHTGSYENVPVTIIGLKFGKTAWLIARDSDGVDHRVKSHNFTAA